MNRSQDITDQELASMLSDSSIDRIMAIDTDWQIIAWNHTAEKVSGIKKELVLHKKLLEVFPHIASDREMMNAIDLAFSGFKSFVPAHKLVLHRQHYENHFIPLKNKEGKITGVMNIMHDVAHRVKAEQQLHRLNIELKKKNEQLERANDELATIIYITSNNFKEPLRHVYSSLELLIRAEGKVLSDGGKANLRRVQASLNRMNLLLDDILALSAINNPPDEGTSVDLNEVLQQARQQLAVKLRSSNAHIETAALPMVNGHRDLLYYIFYHLICNALKFSRHNKPLHIRISSDTVMLQGSNPNGEIETKYIKLSFVDDGTGFQPEDADKIFLMADKAPHKYGSSGAGLAICRKIMMVHKGFIQAEGWPGQGAAFHCFFPLDAKE
jgi:PAS domain S-box-containing protein